MGQNRQKMAPPIYGFLICQDGISEILRCIESVYPYIDKYYVMDGGSKDGTWELLNKYKDVYNLELYQHPYKQQGDQRNRLLAKIPKNSWIISIDQDSKLVAGDVRKFIDEIDPKIYTDKNRHLPLTLGLGFINLVKDAGHYDSNNVITMAQNFFYNDRNLHFTPGYHMSICYFETEYNSNMLPTNWVIKHYAHLNPDRIKAYEDPKERERRSYNEDEWDKKLWKITKLPANWK